GAQVRHLDLNETKGARAHYDQNDDPEYQARAAARSANSGAAAHSTGAGKSSAKSAGKAPGKSAAGGAGGGKPPKSGSSHSGTSGKGGKNGKGGKKKKKGTWWKVLLGTVAAIVLIFMGTLYLITRAIAPEAGSISINQLINTPKEYSGKEFNVLLVGVDRSSETAGGDSEVNDGLTDMIMWLHFNNETGELKMLQIPRNIFVTTDAGFSGNYQINAIAKTQGASGYNDIGALCKYVSDAFQIPIDGYVCIFMEKLTELVDLIGGVQMYVPQVMDYGGSHLDPGYQTLDGAACEFFLRTRHIYSNSDLGRLNMQRYFYAAMFAKLRSMTIWDIAKNLPFYLSMVETSLNINDLVSVALSLKNVSSEKIMLAQVPVYMGGLVYPFNVEHPNSVVVVARQETADLLNTYFRENTGFVDASRLNVRDDVHNVGGITPSDPNVQFMGSLNAEIADAQTNNNIDGSATTDVYDVAGPDAATDGAESGEQPAA
ncbi:MAG: LCP family protein, partial [Gemmiger sp.]